MGAPGTGVGVSEKLCVAFFLQTDPRDDWDRFADLTPGVEAGGVATLGLVAPFIPVVPGTDTYLDEL